MGFSSNNYSEDSPHHVLIFVMCPKYPFRSGQDCLKPAPPHWMLFTYPGASVSGTWSKSKNLKLDIPFQLQGANTYLDEKSIFGGFDC